MKLSDTIIGSIIIGVLVGGAILYSGGGNQDRKHAQIKVLAAPHGEMSSKEIIIDEEIIIDNESDSSMKWHYNCLLYTSPSPRDGIGSRMPSSA